MNLQQFLEVMDFVQKNRLKMMAYQPEHPLRYFYNLCVEKLEGVPFDTYKSYYGVWNQFKNRGSGLRVRTTEISATAS
jgi:hypothetical protein